MHIRAKTVRRLLVLFLAVAVVSGAIAIWLSLSIRRQRLQSARLRQDAFAAYQAHDYEKAVSLFSQYLTLSHSQDTDPEAVFAYGDSRMNAPMEGGRHVYDAINIFEHYLRLASDGPHDARHLLLKLYVQAHDNREARDLSAGLLTKNPSDAEALRGAVDASEADRHYAEALADCQRLNILAPFDLTWQRRELNLMAELNQPAAQVLEHARNLLAAHPNDPRFQVLCALAYRYAGDQANFAKSLEAAAKLPPAGADVVLQIVDLLDVNQQFDLSASLLARAAANDKDPQLLRPVVQRMWEQRRSPQILETLGNIPIDSAKGDPGILGFRALALFDAKRRDEAKAVSDILAARKDDAARGWAIALRTRFDDSLTTATTIRQYADAVRHDPSNAVCHFLLGEAYAGVGETDRAIRQWLFAAECSRSWAGPYCLVSRVLSATGRHAEALRYAQAAWLRAPNTVMVEVPYAIALYGLDAQSNSADANSPKTTELFNLVEAIHKSVQNEPSTLPIYVSLLARRGQRDQAAKVVNDAIAAQPPLAVDTLANLAAASDQEHLGLESAILDRAEKLYGLVPSVAMARALALAHSGKPEDGRRLIEDQCRSHPENIEWELTRARFDEMVGSPDALARWKELGDSHPADVRVQYLILASAMRERDRAFWRRSIDRVKAITGPDGQLWQLEDARWQLAGQPSDKELAAIIASLNQIVHDSPTLAEPHRLLGEALIRTGRPDDLATATAELTAAHDLRDGDLDTTARLAEILAAQGMLPKALELVDSLAQDPHLGHDARLWASSMYDRLGYTDAALKLLTANPVNDDDPAATALLAGLYRRTGRLADAERLYARLLEQPAATPDELIGAAEFFAAGHQPQRVQQYIDRLAKAPLAAGAIDIARARLEEVAGNPREALGILQGAVKSRPQVESLWQELAGSYLRLGKLDDADRAASEGLAAVPSSPVLTAMRTQIARLRSLTPQDVGPLLEVVSHDPHQPIADQALAALVDAKTRNDPTDRIASVLRQLADQHPAFLPLQELLVQRYALMGRFKDAADIASRAGEIAPNDPEPPRMLCAVQSAAGNWIAARQAAARWRQRAAADPIGPDCAIAVTYLQQPAPDPQAALKQLAPYVAADVTQAHKRAATEIYCHALIAAGRGDDAAAMLHPLLSDPHWRLIWFALAVAHHDADAASKWLRDAIPSIPADSVSDQLALADAWERIGSHFDSATAHEAARDTLLPIIARSPDRTAWSQWATVNQSLGNLPEAERAWRECLKTADNDAQVRNNLAYILLLESGSGNLAEAERLARSAIASDPNVATFYDTLARIELRTARADAAVTDFRAALDRNPSSIEAMIGLADVLQTRPSDRDEAKALLLRIDAALQQRPLPATLKSQLDRVKTALSSSM